MGERKGHSWRGGVRAWWSRWLRGWAEAFRGVTIEDDRGRRVPLAKRGAIGEGLSDFKRRELRARIPVDRMKIAMVVVVLIASGLTARVGWLAMTGKPVFAPNWWRLPLNQLWVVFWTLGMFVNTFRAGGGRGGAVDYGARVVGQCLKWGVCPSCGYPLRGATAEEDGRIVCSECGAAWKRERVG